MKTINSIKSNILDQVGFVKDKLVVIDLLSVKIGEADSSKEDLDSMDFIRKELIEKALDEINELELKCKQIN